MRVERNRRAILLGEPNHGTLRKPGNFPRQYYLDRVRRVSLSLAPPGKTPPVQASRKAPLFHLLSLNHKYRTHRKFTVPIRTLPSAAERVTRCWKAPRPPSFNAAIPSCPSKTDRPSARTAALHESPTPPTIGRGAYRRRRKPCRRWCNKRVRLQYRHGHCRARLFRPRRLPAHWRPAR